MRVPFCRYTLLTQAPHRPPLVGTAPTVPTPSQQNVEPHKDSYAGSRTQMGWDQSIRQANRCGDYRTVSAHPLLPGTGLRMLTDGLLAPASRLTSMGLSVILHLNSALRIKAKNVDQDDSCRGDCSVWIIVTLNKKAWLGTSVPVFQPRRNTRRMKGLLNGPEIAFEQVRRRNNHSVASTVPTHELFRKRNAPPGFPVNNNHPGTIFTGEPASPD